MNNKKLTVGRAILAAGYLVLGVILLARPGLMGIVICRTLGVLALAFGGVRAYTSIRARAEDRLFQIDLITAVLLLGFGIFALAQPEVILSILPVTLGVYLLLECVIKVQRSYVLKRLDDPRWWSVLALGALAGVLGAALIARPFSAAEQMLMLLGVGLIVDGGADLWGLWCFASHGE